MDYGLGNLASVANALSKLGIPCEITSEVSALKSAKALILPGVGAAGQGMKNLKERGMDRVLLEHVQKGTPILGICLGMQLLQSFSEEGNVKCLGIVKGNVRKFNTSLKVPEIGWNQMEIQNSKLKNIFKKIPNTSFFYFVNSYYCIPEEKETIIGTTEYGVNFCSMFVKENIYGVQFHPEKSGDVGLQLLKNFWEVVC